MNSIQAFIMGEANRHRERMVFDWDEAARRIKASGCSEASAGLRGDWEWTGGTIFEDGEPCFDSYTFLSSTWAVPELGINGEVEPCYKMEHEVPGWGLIQSGPKAHCIFSI